MGVPFSVSPMSGVDLVSIVPVALTIGTGAATRSERGPALGTIVFGSDGRRYMFCRANTGIAANTATCSVTATAPHDAIGSGGTWRSPPLAMVLGDLGWFSQSHVA